MKVGRDLHLTYCSNIHPGESWPDVRRVLQESLPRVRALLAHDGPLAIGLRQSGAAAETLQQPENLADLRQILADGGYYVFTINGFPYGAFHGTRVKEAVYLPDWRSDERLHYTNRLAQLLAEIVPEGIRGSVSTVPGCFKSSIQSTADVEGMAERMLRHAAHLVGLRERTGATITLAIEPEPACHIETAAEAIEFFENRLFNEPAVKRAGDREGVPLTVEDVRRHVGLCFDVCHMAVEFEDPKSALRRLLDAGIGIFKVQISSALQVDPRAPEQNRALRNFADDTYLHQVTERGAGGLARYVDLPDALASAGEVKNALPVEWRVHFHVPIFCSSLGPLNTTQPYVISALAEVKRLDACAFFEVETYTWGVLPAEFRTTDACTAIARELRWARTQLED